MSAPAPERQVVAPAERTIFAMGGGGFTMEPANPLLDDYVLSLPQAREPKILFLPTASGDTTPQINAFKARFHGRNCVAEHLSLFRLRETRRPLRELLAEQDVLYVGGGSMRNLLAIWRAHELDTMLIECWERGIVLAGLSAGAMCWFQWGVTRSSGPPEPLEGLGLLEGSRRRRARAAARLARPAACRRAARGLGAGRRRRAAVPWPAARADRQLPARRRSAAGRLDRR